ANWAITEEAVEVTGSNPVFTDVDRTLVVPGADFTSLIHPKAIGLLLYGALGSIATTGAGVPYQHVLTPALDLPYLTFFGKAFGGDYMTVQDVKIDSLEITQNNAGRLFVAATMMGLLFAWGATPFTPTNDESAGGTPLFRAGGGTFKMDPASGTPVVRNIVSSSLRINNSMDIVPQSSSVQPGDVLPAVKDIEVSMTLAPDDLTDIRKALTGSGTGTTISNTPVYGSTDWFYTIDANTDLRLVTSRLQALIDMPEADPKGGHLPVVVAGKALQPASGAAVTATVHNAVASYLPRPGLSEPGPRSGERPRIPELLAR